eukprot:1903683-Prymnesium_polylepis.1
MGRSARGLHGRTPAHVAWYYASAGRSNSLRVIDPCRTCLSHAADSRCANVARSPQWRSGRAVDGPGRCGAFFRRAIHVDMPDLGSSGRRRPQRPASLTDRAEVVHCQNLVKSEAGLTRLKREAFVERGNWHVFSDVVQP